MKYLLDTNILLWSLDEDKKLGNTIKSIISDPKNEIYVSIVSCWEISIKAKIKKLPLKTTLQVVFDNIQFDFLNITLEHILGVYDLPLHHKDPFDRMLIAQAKAENMILLTSDPKFKKYKVPILA